MKILILASGGDCAGMNSAIYELCRGLKNKHEIYFCYEGYQGLIENKIVEMDFDAISSAKNNGGVLIRSSRSSEFMTDKGFEKALENLKNHSIEKLIILGGNGSYEGAKRLSKIIDVSFIPATIDNDFPYSDYSLGFDTATQNTVTYIENVKMTFASFNRTGIFEVMGRDKGDIATSVSKIVNADLCITKKENVSVIAKKIQKIKLTNPSPTIIVKEYLYDIIPFAMEIEENIKSPVRGCVVGYFQRGGNPTKKEKIFAKKFANKLIKNINKKNIIIVFKNNLFCTENIK